MSISLILQAILAVLKFPSEMSAFIRLISKSTEEKLAEIHKKNLADVEEMEKTGRPKWD